MSAFYDFTPGRLPLLVSIPHSGTELTPEIDDALSAREHVLSDTDWHVPRLYDFLEPLGANIIRAQYSRYVIDLNRPPDDAPLYSTATTGLFPETRFDGQPLFDKIPSTEHRRYCLEQIWQPYHQRIQDELERLHATFGYALLFDAHSIRSRIPRLFEGQLPDLNLGTNEGQSCASGLTNHLQAICKRADQFSHVVNGRFKGGYITRRYGRPKKRYHAVQLELAQCNYMDECPPYPYRRDRARSLQPILQELIETLLDWGRKCA